jgi:hypothetical protein
MRLIKDNGMEAAAKAAFNPQISDLAALIVIGSALAAIFLIRLPGRPLFPVRDPRLAESLAVRN